jgi:tRNA (mo5U34)-methyltransferase
MRRNATKINEFKQFLGRQEFAKWCDQLLAQALYNIRPERHGDLSRWQAAVDNLPALSTDYKIYDGSRISIGEVSEILPADKQQLKKSLMELHPWRKGPYELFGLHVDSEWRSDWKWDRLAAHLPDMNGQNVLDVGCGNGYHCWRMLGCGANYVLGIDPSVKFLIQHQAINQYARETRFDFLPLASEHLPEDLAYFDTVFSMGVIYHRRTPQNHLAELHNAMVTGGTLILETLIVDEAANGLLKPASRYAQMSNVWFIPTVSKLTEELAKAKFINIRCVDINETSMNEQRSTDWMKFYSLKNYLNATNPAITIEGYPRPKRAILIANRA